MDLGTMRCNLDKFAASLILPNAATAKTIAHAPCIGVALVLFKKRPRSCALVDRL